MCVNTARCMQRHILQQMHFKNETKKMVHELSELLEPQNGQHGSSIVRSGVGLNSLSCLRRMQRMTYILLQQAIT